MAQTFKRLFAPVTSLSPGEFTVDTETTRPALCCPYCSIVFDLASGFHYDAAGRINYAVQCPGGRCGFWDFCILDGVWEDP